MPILEWRMEKWIYQRILFTHLLCNTPHKHHSNLHSHLLSVFFKLLLFATWCVFQPEVATFFPSKLVTENYSASTWQIIWEPSYESDAPRMLFWCRFAEKIVKMTKNIQSQSKTFLLVLSYITDYFPISLKCRNRLNHKHRKLIDIRHLLLYMTVMTILS